MAARHSWWLLCLALVLSGCPDDDPDGGVDGGADGASGEVDALPNDEGVSADGAPPDGDILDGGVLDATPDQGPVDLCADVECDADALCDPLTGDCAIVGEPAPGEPAGACASDEDCGEGACLTDTPGGFCQSPCDEDLRCGSVDQRCAAVGDVGGGAPLHVCLDECAVTGCREGWICVPDAEGPVCLPHCTQGGCNARSYCDAATGMCEPFEGPAIEDGEPCNARDDRCGAGLACLPDDDDGNGACRALCEPTDAPCPDDAFCAILYDVAEGEPEIGICLPGDGCDPLAPEEICGPDGACVAAPPVTLCVGVGPQPLGAGCDAERLCEPGLICQYGACKRPCAEAEDCEAGEGCVDYGARVGQPFGFCHRECDPLRDLGCDRGEHCTLIDMFDDAPLGACAGGRIGAQREGDACQPGATYHGDCAPDHLCDLQAPGEPTCRRLCTAAAAGGCSGGVCAGGLFEAPFEALGLCIGGCNVLSPRTDCPGGVVPQICVFTGLLGTDGQGREVLVGECLPAIGGAPRAIGQPCELDEELGTHNCANGSICASLEAGAPLECVQLCLAPAPGGRNPCRQAERACVTDLFGGSERFGACLP